MLPYISSRLIAEVHRRMPSKSAIHLADKLKELWRMQVGEDFSTQCLLLHRS